MQRGQDVGKCRFQRMRQKTRVVRLGRIRRKSDTSPNTETGRIWSGTFDMHIRNDTSFTLQHTGYLGGQVPGRQTVPRTELWGAIQILSRVDGEWRLVVDPFPADRRAQRCHRCYQG